MGKTCEAYSANETAEIYNDVIEEEEKGYDFIAEVKKQYPYISDNDVVRIVNKAKMFYWGATIPCGTSTINEKTPITAFFDIQWILTACEELIERLGFTSVTAYKENGISWNFDNAHISERLMSIIRPMVCVI